LKSSTQIKIAVLLCFVATMFFNNCSAKEINVRPSINDHYYNAKYEQWLDTFESSGREVFDKKEQIIQALQIQPGQKIADIGAGTGLYTIPFAQLVGEKGIIYAVDISADFIKNIEIRAKGQGLKNVVGHINKQKEIGLTNNSIDLAFICNTYHHFEYPITTMKSVYQALTPGGKLVVIDFQRDPKISSSWVMGHVRAEKEKVIEEIESIGFKLIDDNNQLKQNYFLSFSK